MPKQARRISKQEVLLMKRVKKAIAAWLNEPGATRTITGLKDMTGFSYPTLRRLRNWKKPNALPELETIVPVLEAIGKRLKIVDL